MPHHICWNISELTQFWRLAIQTAGKPRKTFARSVRSAIWARQGIGYPPTGVEIIGELGTIASLPTRRRSAHRALDRGCQGAPYFSFVKTPAECRCGRSRRAGNPRLLNENGRPFAATSIRSKIEQ